MAISLPYTASDGQVPTAANFMANFSELVNNGVDLWSPATKNIDLDGFSIILDAAGVTSVNSTAAIAWNFTPGAKSGTPSTTGGIQNWAASTYTDSATAASGTATAWVGHALQRPTLAATNTSVVTTDAATLYIPNAPAAGTNQTLTNPWALWVDAGNTRLDGSLRVDGTVMGVMGQGDISNIGLASSVASSAWTIALNGADGNNPSSSNPCRAVIRSATLTTGTPVTLTRTSALSLVVPNTATLGTTSGVAYRIWIGATTTDGTTWDALCVFNTQGTTQLYPLPSESALHSATAIGTGSDSAGVLYGSSATTSMPIKWIGYAEISEAVAGVWNTEETKIQVMGPGVHFSGKVLQHVFATTTTTTNNDTSTYADTTLTATITPTSTLSRIRTTVIQNGVHEATNLGGGVNIKLLGGGSDLAVIVIGGATGDATGNSRNSYAVVYEDAPQTVAARIYKTQFAHVTNNARAVVQQDSVVSSILLEEFFS